MELDRHKYKTSYNPNIVINMTHPFTLLIATGMLLLHYQPIIFFHNHLPYLMITTHIQSHPITEISIPSIPTQHSPERLYHPHQSEHLPKQRLFQPMKHQQGIWTKDRLRKFYPLYSSTSSPFSSSSSSSSLTTKLCESPHQLPPSKYTYQELNDRINRITIDYNNSPYHLNQT